MGTFVCDSRVMLCRVELKSEQMSLLQNMASDSAVLTLVRSVSNHTCWGMCSDQCLDADGFSSVDGFEGQHHCIDLDVGRNRKPVEVTEEGGRINSAQCTIQVS